MTRDDAPIVATAIASLAVAVGLGIRHHGTPWMEQPWWVNAARTASTSVFSTCLIRFGTSRVEK
jgi:hypothetical protein